MFHSLRILCRETLSPSVAMAIVARTTAPKSFDANGTPNQSLSPNMTAVSSVLGRDRLKGG